ncbi:CCA tRNA nucleotidyltransferase [Fodinicurvata fenggangensis]|uniref:CCA tRNA nucleotidyltransferase n=1 Tax=Fodinicurvata fenggangensis TaxID=1121830 RepID=UPI0005502181|nr:CCA tRNA nucleotidyltransferase [Fodinicurvata fenggangensis]
MEERHAAVRRITPPVLGDPDAVTEVLEALGAAAVEVRYVGGCVRDSLLGRFLSDIDLATPAPPERVMEVLQAAGVKVIPTGLSHGTVMAVVRGQPFEITTLRRDVETDGRRAVVAFTDCWRADAARRDLTMNALSCDPEGWLYDYFGGLEDLEAGRVRFIGDPAVRIAEDYLRLLRFYRFLAHYGRTRPEETALRATAEAAPQLATLSGERIRVELLKLLAAPEPENTLTLMAEQGILPHLLPDRLDIASLGRLRALELAADSLLRLAALLPAAPEAVERTSQRLRLSRVETSRLAALCQADAFKRYPPDTLELRRALHERGPQLVADQLRVIAARLDEPLSDDVMARVDNWTPKPLPIKGRDLLADGFEKGPALGRLLSQLEDWWLEQDRKPDHRDLLEKARSLQQRQDGASR